MRSLRAEDDEPVGDLRVAHHVRLMADDRRAQRALEQRRAADPSAPSAASSGIATHAVAKYGPGAFT